ncbi:hypothetical protein [Mycoplasma phocoenae]|uniref:Uncharacterized protein n=1 Tax=Mycoplasma phocoenae TaxID=754517 RepID=A0A858U5S2_9MOLU|nr:hypothetical protein [Mycoplasma phocoenae]QJG66787.1 hypothetical protein HGG69_00365 [Mycoplasma phocoenae]
MKKVKLNIGQIYNSWSEYIDDKSFNKCVLESLNNYESNVFSHNIFQSDEVANIIIEVSNMMIELITSYETMRKYSVHLFFSECMLIKNERSRYIEALFDVFWHNECLSQIMDIIKYYKKKILSLLKRKKSILANLSIDYDKFRIDFVNKIDMILDFIENCNIIAIEYIITNSRFLTYFTGLSKEDRDSMAVELEDQTKSEFSDSISFEDDIYNNDLNKEIN